jgi:hypothetical protein
MTTIPQQWWPSTTRILADLRKGWMDEAALKRGQAVHKACAWIASGQTPAKEWSPKTVDYIEPWVSGFRKMLREHEWQHEQHETEFVCQAERFVSHPDLLGWLDRPTERTVLEIKSGLFPETVRLQTAGQVIAVGPRDIRRMVVRLPGDGTYKLTLLTDYRDFDAFLICARYWWIKESYGMNEVIE